MREWEGGGWGGETSCRHGVRPFRTWQSSPTQKRGTYPNSFPLVVALFSPPLLPSLFIHSPPFRSLPRRTPPHPLFAPFLILLPLITAALSFYFQPSASEFEATHCKTPKVIVNAIYAYIVYIYIKTGNYKRLPQKKRKITPSLYFSINILHWKRN